MIVVLHWFQTPHVWDIHHLYPLQHFSVLLDFFSFLYCEICWFPGLVSWSVNLWGFLLMCVWNDDVSAVCRVRNVTCTACTSYFIPITEMSFWPRSSSNNRYQFPQDVKFQFCLFDFEAMKKKGKSQIALCRNALTTLKNVLQYYHSSLAMCDAMKMVFFEGELNENYSFYFALQLARGLYLLIFKFIKCKNFLNVFN